jgi:hypothetical protein
MHPKCGTCKYWISSVKECCCALPLWVIECLEEGGAFDPDNWVIDENKDATNCSRYETKTTVLRKQGK